VERKKQKGNTVHFSTTVTPLHLALVQGLVVSQLSPLIGTRVARGSLAEYLMPLIERDFSAKYGLPFYLLKEILEESGVLEEMDIPEGKQDRGKLYPLEHTVVQAVVDAYNQKLISFNYGEGQE
jgi:hypothetical protein